MGIHPVFNVSLLNMYHGNKRRPAPVEIDGELEYEVESIVSHKKVGRNWHFLVTWIGYDVSENMWIPQRKLGNAQEVVSEYM